MSAERGRIDYWSRKLIALSALFALLLAFLFLPSRHVVYSAPLSEDGFYMLSVARNLGMGAGLTIDGAVLTNGIQPLFTLLMAPLYALFGGERHLTLHAVLAVHWIIHLATAFTLGRVAAALVPDRTEVVARRTFWITVVVWLTSAQVLVHSYNGLETGLLMLGYAVIWRLLQVWDLNGRHSVILAVLCGLLVLARIDAAVFVAVFVALTLLTGRGDLGPAVTRAFIISVGAFIVSAPWWAYNLVVFGSLMPSSGAAQRGVFSFDHLYAMAQNVLSAATPWLPFTAYALKPWQGIVLQTVQVAVILSVTVALSRGLRAQPGRCGSLVMPAALVITVGVLAAYYTSQSDAVHFYGRYMAPLMALIVPLTGVALADRRRRFVLLAAALVVISVGFGTLRVQRWLADSESGAGFYSEQVKLVERSVPAGEVVAAGQSGTLGYFRDDVVNLDGKVNPEALDGKGGLGLSSRIHYLNEEGIRWYCDWDTYAAAQLGSRPEQGGWALVDTEGRTRLYHRTDASFVP